jgi:hypothetical protein
VPVEHFAAEVGRISDTEDAMPNEIPQSQPPADPTAPPDTAIEAPPSPAETAGAGGPTINIGDEFGTAKRNLPPAKIVAIGIASVLIIGAIIVFTQTRPPGKGSMDDVGAVDIPGQNSVLVTINVTVANGAKKSLYIHTLKATLTTDKDYEDEAASPVDFDRYFQAFPALKAHAVQPLTVETKIPPGGEAKGTIMVSFPVTLDQFNARKSLSVTIQPYDQLPIVIKK